MKLVQMGERQLELGGTYMTELKESNDILDDYEALHRRMSEDGYLFIRGFHDKEQVLRAKREYLVKMHELGRLADGTALEEGIIGPDNKGEAMEVKDAIMIMFLFGMFILVF